MFNYITYILLFVLQFINQIASPLEAGHPHNNFTLTALLALILKACAWIEKLCN